MLSLLSLLLTVNTLYHFAESEYEVIINYNNIFDPKKPENGEFIELTSLCGEIPFRGKGQKVKRDLTAKQKQLNCLKVLN